MAIYLGIDGGGSKTTCALGDDTTVLATATTGGSNVVRVGEVTARQNLHAAISQACAAVRVRPEDIASAVVGMAGASVSEYNEAVLRLISDRVGGPVTVVGDYVIAFEAAFSGRPGVIVIAGTGSIAFGRNERGNTARAGGYGFEISDEGSGHWIGRRAVAAALRTHDRGDDSLLSAVLAAWNLSSLEHLVQAANATPRPDFSELVPVVVECAAQQNVDCSGILADAGRELAALAGAVIARLWPLVEGENRVATGGGVFAHSLGVRQSFGATLRETYPNVAVRAEIVEPVLGALWLARNRALSNLRRNEHE